ncbi:hypothetical protein [Pseudoduganella sp.]|uniref:hypothetical protein n=1 Tax=Pseudoduganella sp. TaxID=1880898 RepID=UPI0035B22359
MNTSFQAVLLCALTFGLPANASEERNEVKLPRNATKFCDEHVSGAPASDGRPGPHIIWHAYSSVDSPDAIVRYYAEQFGQKAGVAHDGSPEWRLGPEHARWIYAIHPASAQGKMWRRCEVPASAKTVVWISVFISAPGS